MGLVSKLTISHFISQNFMTQLIRKLIRKIYSNTFSTPCGNAHNDITTFEADGMVWIVKKNITTGSYPEGISYWLTSVGAQKNDPTKQKVRFWIYPVCFLKNKFYETVQVFGPVLVFSVPHPNIFWVYYIFWAYYCRYSRKRQDSRKRACWFWNMGLRHRCTFVLGLELTGPMTSSFDYLSVLICLTTVQN